MTQQNLGGMKAFNASEDLEAFRRVKLTSGSGVAVEYADAGEAYIGFTQKKVASGERVTVGLKTSGKTFKAIAKEAFSVGATLYGGDDGKVQDTSSGTAQATALEAATAENDEVEVLPL